MKTHAAIQFGLIVSVLALLISCSSNEASVHQDRAEDVLKVTYVDYGGEQPMAKLMIEGMSCERMCVSAVKKSMANVPTVEIQEMHFDAEVDVDTLIVHFDPLKVTEEQLVRAVEDLVGGDTYHVKEIHLSKDAKSSCRTAPSADKKKTKTEAKQFIFSVPNPFEVLRKVAL